jgi:sialic acid synthase SpsE/mannose-6-phosphate isomerase-like protein (cupin superfamily)
MQKEHKPLFIFEMANNHQGSVEHGKLIIRKIREVCDDFPEFDFAFKFQYRNLDTFIHPDYRQRMDIKNVKRFQETRLDRGQFEELLTEVRKNGFLAVCTPFDEPSVDMIAEQKYDYIKIASCSFGDWPLLEKIAEKKMPVIASGAGSSDSMLHDVVNFFLNRNVPFSLMHCVAEYPTENEHLQLNQIDYYHNQFPGIRIGFSTHENPDNMLPIRIAVAKGAEIFEKHVGVPTDTISLNGYSANPEQVRRWLAAARETYGACGVKGERYKSTEKEQSDLAALKRGVFAKSGLAAGMALDSSNTFLAFPCIPGQLVTEDLSKYNRMILKKPAGENSPIMREDVEIANVHANVLDLVKELIAVLKDGNIVVPVGSCCELSHHYGIEKYHEVGVAIIDCVNREYCKKILAVLPGQTHPVHFHKKKEETFVVLNGELFVTLNGKKHKLGKGDVMTVERGAAHSFYSDKGCVFEEISTTHYKDDSYYEDMDSFVNPRKTEVHFTDAMLGIINGESN